MASILPGMTRPPAKLNVLQVSELLVKMLEQREDYGEEIERYARLLKAARRLNQDIRMRSIEPILNKLPGEASPQARAKLLGVSRQSYYAWLWGRQRPSEEQAKKISKLTGVPVKDIRGK